MDLQLILNERNIVSTKRKRSGEDAGPNEQLTAPHPPQNRSRNSESICDQCSQVDWDSVPTLAARGLLDNDMRVLRPIYESSSQLAASSCRICRILSLINCPSLGKRQCVVYAQRLSEQWSSSAAQIQGSKKVTVLSIAPQAHDAWPTNRPRCLVALTRSGDKDSRLILPRSINYDKLKHLIRSCRETHPSLCTAGSFYQVSGLRVIDVSSRTVVVAPENCRYLALSYVWGQQPGPTNGDSLQSAPPLIQDAISVAISLEYKYLWVDKYCIPQDNPQEKHHMISQMDQVYTNASVTIIAATGENVQIGLPGVSISARQPQRWVDVQDTTLLELPCGENNLLTSKWASRGWTYQEGYLSRRRIMFTPNQVLFLCNKQYLEEYVHVLLKDQEIPPFRNIEGLTRIFPSFSPTGSLATASLLHKVEEYSLRELSYSSDSLNAFRGILNYYTTGRFRGEFPTTHLGWGLLATRKGPNLCVHLDWYHQTLAYRRHEFPSWAWTGWGGPLNSRQGILVRRKDDKHSFPLQDFAWEVSIEAEGGETLEMYELDIYLRNAVVANGGLNPGFVELSPRRLLITCRVSPIHFLKIEPRSAQRGQQTEVEFKSTGEVMKIVQRNFDNLSFAVLELWDGIYVGASYYLDDNVKQEDVIIGLHFISESVVHGLGTKIDCLLVRQVEEGLYERVGLVHSMLPSGMDEIESRYIFFDEAGRLLERITIPEKITQQSFDGFGEKKTICLL